MINSDLIKKRMKELGVTNKALGEVLGLKQPTVSQKINEVRPLLLSEAEIIAEVLHISDEEFSNFFFARDRKGPCEKLCCNCNRWKQFYLRTDAGPFVESSYGLCIKSGRKGVREGSETCEQYQQRE